MEVPLNRSNKHMERVLLVCDYAKRVEEFCEMYKQGKINEAEEFYEREIKPLITEQLRFSREVIGGV